MAVAVSPDNRSVYVANRDGSVSQYDIGAGGALAPKNPATVPAGSLPVGLAISPAPELPTRFAQCRSGGWREFGFKSEARCVTFVFLTRVCEFFERRHVHLKFCPPAPPPAVRRQVSP